MNKQPKVSVITPSFNQGEFIERTIKSVLSQSYKNIEYIIIDGGSKDKTLKILKKYKNQLKWISEKDKGQSDAINKGVKRSSGEIICWLNSDDCYFPHAIKYVVDYFIKNPEIKWVTGDYIIINKKDKEIRSYVKFYKRFFRHFPSLTILMLVNFIVQPSTFWRREIVEKCGELALTKYTMDFDYWLRIYKKFPLGIIHKPLSKFRVHSKSIGGSLYKSEFNEVIYLLQKYTKNPFIIGFNKLHYRLVRFVYDFNKSS
jgi:glycosyltransferase involved in cell wall biosynthesis